MNPKIVALSIVMILLASVYIPSIYGDTYTTSAGILSLEGPEIQYMKIVELGGGENITTLTVHTSYDFIIYTYDINGTADMKNMTIRFQKNPGNLIAADTPDFVENTEYWFRYLVSAGGSAYDANQWYNGTAWVNFTTAFHLDPSFLFSHVGTSSEVRWRVHLSKAMEWSTQWNFAALVYDLEDNTDTMNYGGVTVSFYTELSGTDSSHAWKTKSGETNVVLSLPVDGQIGFTVITNAVYKIQAKGSADLSGGGGTVGIGNVTVHKETLGSSIPLTLAYADVLGLTSQALPATESGTVTYCTLWIDVPADLPSGQYTYTLYIQLTK